MLNRDETTAATQCQHGMMHVLDESLFRSAVLGVTAFNLDADVSVL